MDILFLVFGIIGGLLGGMGMGGGTLLIPLLSVGLSVGQRTAQLLNLVTFMPMSAVALILHAKNGYVVKEKLLFVIVPAVLTSVVGAYFASVIDTEVLKKAFGGFLILLGVLYFFKEIFSKNKVVKC